MPESITSLRVNTSYIEQEQGGLTRREEIVAITSEPEYVLSNDHEVIRQRECHTHRLDVGLDGLKILKDFCETLIEQHENDPLISEDKRND